jgi:general secretion pathway protein K
MVLGALTVLTVMLMEFQDETSAELGSALAERDALRAEYAARSAINLSRLLIAAEPTMRKSLAPLLGMVMGGSPPQLPVWQLADELLGAFNDQARQESFAQLTAVDLAQGKGLAMEGVSFDVQIVDEDSKLNLNVPARGTPGGQKQVSEQVMTLIGGPQYDVMFESRDDDGNYNRRATVCGALIDWIDPDQDQYVCQEDGNAVHAGSVAAEDSYYARLKRPYERKNAAFDSLEELHLVRGVTQEFWRTFIEPNPDNPASRNVTVWGSGKVNINTANPAVIWNLVCSQAVNRAAEPFCSDPAQLATFIGVMNAKDMFTRGMPLFASPKAFLNVILGKGGGLAKMILIDMFQLTPISQVRSNNVLLDKVSAESKVFSIYATGVAHSGKRETRVRIHAVVDFRQAPPPGQNRNLADIMDMAGGDPTASQATETPTNPDDPSEELPEEALLDALRKDPGGNVVYYRLD